MQEQNSEKTVALAVKTGKMSAKVLKDCMKAFLALQKNKSPKVYKRKQSVKQLTSSGAQLTNIEVTDQNIKAFDKTARKYGIDYALKKETFPQGLIAGDKSDLSVTDSREMPAGAPRYFVFFKAKDMDVLTMAFKEFSANQLKKEKKPSIRAQLKTLSEQVKAKVHERTRQKSKSKEAEL